jgi:hypothetical protein
MRRAECQKAIAQPSSGSSRTRSIKRRAAIPTPWPDRIVAALAEAGYSIVLANGIEDTAIGPQPFDKLTREMRPQDPFGDGRDWTFRTDEHGGDEPDNMPQTIKATDVAGRWAIYVPLTRSGKIVVPRPYPETVSSNRAEMRQLCEHRVLCSR